MEDMTRLGLQFFAAEGAAGGESGGGADPGVNAAAPGQEEDLEKLGVPRAEAEKYGAKMKRPDAPEEKPEAPAAEEGQTPAAEAKPEEKPARTSLAELARQDPEINRELQGIIRERVKGFAADRDTLKGLMPALEILAKSYGQDTSQGIDFEALNKAVTEDDRYWEAKAAEYGVTPDIARKIEGFDQMEAEREQREQDELLQQQFRAHIGKMVQQAEEMKQLFPDFDLWKELQDPTFKRLTSPDVGLSVKDAFYTVHREQIRQAENALIARRTQEAMANSIAAGQNRPKEGGSSKAASTGGVSRSRWTLTDIEEVKRRAAEANARGEKFYIDR